MGWCRAGATHSIGAHFGRTNIRLAIRLAKFGHWWHHLGMSWTSGEKAKFVEIVRLWMDVRQVRPRDLLAVLEQEPDLFEHHVDESKLRNWLRGHTEPPLSALSPIGRYLKMSDDGEEFDPTYLPRQLGIIHESPDEHAAVRLAVRLAKLQTKMEEATRSVAEVGRSEGAANIVRAGLARRFAVAVFPAIEGPPGYGMHVADRLDIAQADGSPTTRDDVWNEPELRTALRSVGAIGSNRGPRWHHAPGRDSGVSHWSISHVGAPSSAAVNLPHLGMKAVSIVATTVDSWVTDVGALLAMFLGYGYTSVRDLATELSGNPTTDEHERRLVHQSFLYRDTPARRVWANHGMTFPAGDKYYPFRDAQGRVDPDILQVVLAESDEQLQFSIERRSHMGMATAISLEQMIESRNELIRRSDEVENLLQIPVTHRQGDTIAHQWTQVLDCVRAILVELKARDVRLHLDHVHERLQRREPGIAPQLLRWLADHGAPYVSGRYSTDSTLGHRRATQHR